MDGIQKLLNRQLTEAPSSTESDAPQTWLSANDLYGHGAPLEEQTLRCIQACLLENKAERKTATALLIEPPFTSFHKVQPRPRHIPLQHTAYLQFTLRHLCPALDPSLQRWSLLHHIHEKLTINFDVELFTEESNPSLPFEKRTTNEAAAFFDDYLEHDPVYLLKLGESCRLRLQLSWDPQVPLPIEKFASVVVKVSDAEEQSLDIAQSIEIGSATALISFDPKRIPSDRLNSISPTFGLTDKKYVQVTICTQLQLSDSFLLECELHHPLYFKLIYPNNRLRLYKWLGMLVTKKEIRRRQQQAREALRDRAAKHKITFSKPQSSRHT